jgi:hypothetical protein
MWAQLLRAKPSSNSYQKVVQLLEALHKFRHQVFHSQFLAFDLKFWRRQKMFFIIVGQDVEPYGTILPT